MIASRMIEKRLERGLSVPELARRLGVAKTTVYRYESGAIEKMPVERLIEIAGILDTSPAYLMFGLEEADDTESSVKECFMLSRRLNETERKKVEQYLTRLLKE